MNNDLSAASAVEPELRRIASRMGYGVVLTPNHIKIWGRMGAPMQKLIDEGVVIVSKPIPRR